ncbi:MAG: HD domain-containing protein [Clostridia bacterium]|nr:HD domain-containing protein [Clostridia bacterium]
MTDTQKKRFLKIVTELARTSRLSSQAGYTQHGNTSCLLHSIAVAYHCYKWAIKLGEHRFASDELIRGALLHDYFLYDWHYNAFPPNGLHGFSHPLTAWQNASKDFKLTEREADIIRKHMFPLTITKIPKYRESVIITLVDKYCSLYEVFSRNTYNIPLIRQAEKIILKNKDTAVI